MPPTTRVTNRKHIGDQLIHRYNVDIAQKHFSQTPNDAQVRLINILNDGVLSGKFRFHVTGSGDDSTLHIQKMNSSGVYVTKFSLS